MTSDVFVIDSSVFVAFYYAGDAEHVSAGRIMAELNQKTLIVHPYVIQETATVLTYKFGFAAARSFLSDISAARNVVVPPVTVASDIKAFLQLGKQISFADATLVQLAKIMNAYLVTFDRQMLSLYKNL